MSVEIKKDSESKKFIALVDGQEAGSLKFEDFTENIKAFVSVHTAEEFRGQGIAGQLTAAGFADAKAEGYKVQPVCPYVVAWVPKHPEVADQVA